MKKAVKKAIKVLQKDFEKRTGIRAKDQPKMSKIGKKQGRMA